MIILQLIMFFGCHCTNGMEIANLLTKGAVSLYSLYKSQQTGGNRIGHVGMPKIGVGFANGQQDWSDAQLCAAELTYKLSSAIMADDEFSQRTSYVAGNWRDPASTSHVPLAIGCVPEGFDRRKAKIVCRAQIERATEEVSGVGEEPRREIFARYWAYFPATDTDGVMAQEHALRLEALEAFGALPPDGPISTLFTRGHGARLFSPFHPAASHFDVQFRSKRRQSICKVILDTRYERQIGEGEEDMIAIERLASSHPELFHRLMSDVFSPVPAGLPPVAPKPVESLGHVKDLLPRLYDFIDPYRFGGWKGDYTVAEDESNAVDSEGFVTQVPLSLLAERLKRCITLTSAALETKKTPLYRCDHGPVGWSRDWRCPGTSMCYDSPLCSRMVACGEGLWLTIRGQYTLEATGRIVKSYTPEMFLETLTGYAPSVYDYDPTTQAFYDFPPKERDRLDDDGIIWQKLHVSKGTSSFFAVIFYQPSADSSGVGDRYWRREQFEEKRREEARPRPVSKRNTDEGVSLEQKIEAECNAASGPSAPRATQRRSAVAKDCGKSFYADFNDGQPIAPPAPPQGQKSFYQSFDSDSGDYKSPITSEDDEICYTSSQCPQPQISRMAGKTYLVQDDAPPKQSAEDDVDEFVLLTNTPPVATSEAPILLRNAPSANPFKRHPNPGYVQRPVDARPQGTGRLPPLGPSGDKPSVTMSTSFAATMRNVRVDEKY